MARGGKTRARTFAAGWTSVKHPELVALIWQVNDPPDANLPVYEAEVVRDLDFVEMLRAPSVDELKGILSSKYDT